jgi:tol-pal system protein YbgF
MRNKLHIVTLIGAASLAMASAPAFARTKDDIIDLQERMSRVEQTVAGQSAQTVRISELESEIQALTGLIEELTYQLDISNQRLDAVSAVLAGDSLGAAAAATALSPDAGQARGPVDLTTGDPIADQLRNETTGNASASGPGPGASDIALPLNPDAAYDYASAFLLQGDYQRAKAAFELYVQAFPNHARTADAQFRLGEIYLALGENASAADTFIGHIRQYPTDPRAAEAYLKLGTAFARLDKPDEACTVFRTMKTKYPNATAAVTQRANLEMARINCK